MTTPCDDSLELDVARKRLASAADELRLARIAYFKERAEIARLRRQILSPVETAIADIGRARHRQFARKLVRELSEGSTIGAAIQSSVRQTFQKLRSERAIQSKAREMGSRPGILAVISAAANG